MRTGFVTLALWSCALTGCTAPAPPQPLLTAGPLLSLDATVDASAVDVPTVDAPTDLGVAAETDALETVAADPPPTVAPDGIRDTCDPCTASESCSFLGADAACVAIGKPVRSEGLACLAACTISAQCPAGVLCDDRLL